MTASGKQNLLFIIDFNHEYLSPFVSSVANEANLFFLNYAYPSEVKSRSFEAFGTIVFWTAFKNADDLIKKLKPSKVIFFELETLNQVALNVACKKHDIPTVFCDHGLQDIKIIAALNKTPGFRPTESKINRLKGVFEKGIINVLRNKRFFQQSISKNSEAEQDFLKKYQTIRLSNSIFHTYQKINDPLLYPDAYYCFSEKNYEYHRYLNHDQDLPVHYFGIPEYDGYELIEGNLTAQDVLYIDQPYCHFGYYGWTESNKIAWLQQLQKVCNKKQRKLFIKKHPRETDIWDQLPEAHFIGNDLYQHMKNIGVVLGFNSTLLMPLAALDHTALFCFRHHPNGSTNQTAIFVEAGVAQWIEDLDSVGQSLEEVAQIRSRQQINKSKFITQWMHRFDGQSSKRLKELLLSS